LSEFYVRSLNDTRPPAVTREWVINQVDGILYSGSIEDVDDPDGLLDALCSMLRDAGVNVVDGGKP